MLDTKFNEYIQKTFLWMFIGIFITFITSLIISSNENFIYAIYSNSFLPILFIILELSVVILFTWRLKKIKISTARVLFVFYSFLTGISFSTLSIAYTGESIALAFGITCLFFGLLVLFGFVTKKDFSKIGFICIIGLLVLIIFEVISFLLKIPMNVQIISIIGLILFVGITIWDTQKMKKRYYNSVGNYELQSKMSILSAFELYLDFINIFIDILRLIGNSNN